MTIMKIYDVTLPLSERQVIWPGDPPVSFKLIKSILNGDPCNVTKIEMGAHSGTHIDAPFHFFKNGATTDSIPLHTFIGQCLVIDTDSKFAVEKKDLIKYDISKYSKILIKTKNSELWANNVDSFTPYFIFLSIDAAKYLVEMNVSLVGIDYLTIEAFNSSDNQVHKLLLRNNITILEGLDLSKIKSGIYNLICMPLKIEGCEAAPARVVLQDSTI